MLMNYQGRVTNQGNSPIATPITVSFSFWSAESGGFQLGAGWSDSDPVTPDPNGLFSTLIGDDPTGIPADIFSTDEVYLNVNINGENLSPRKRVVSSAFAFQSRTTSEVLTPFDFGAIGDGVADDTLSLQTALNTGKVVQLPPGRYRITHRLTIPSGGGLSGSGTIYHDFDLSPPSGPVSPFDVAIFIQNDEVLLEGFRLEKHFVDGSYATGIATGSVERLTIRNLDITGYSARYGIFIVDSGDFEVSGCHIHNFMMNTTADMIQDSPAGLRVTRSHRGIISRNRILAIEVGPTGRASISPISPGYGPQRYQADCMTVMQCTEVTVDGNVCNTSGEGIDMLLSNSCTVSNNVVSNIFHMGIKMLGVSYSAVHGNYLADCWRGIGVEAHPSFNAEASGNAIIGNIMRDMGSLGTFGAPDSERLLLPTQWGILIETKGAKPARYNVVSDNIVLDTQAVKTTDGGVTDAGSNNTLRDNVFTSAIGP
jgi:parallel beta-helix repeat protein